MKLAKRLSLIKPSPTLMVTVQVAALRRQGIQVIDFGAGEPDFDTPEHIKQAAIKSIEEGNTKYTPVAGTNELRQVISKKFLLGFSVWLVGFPLVLRQ